MAYKHEHIWVAVPPPKKLKLRFTFRPGYGDYYCEICGLEKYADA